MKKLFTKFAILLLAMMIALPSISFSSDFDVEEMKRNLPKLLGASNVGTEFFLTFHPPWPTSGAKNFIKIYVSSGVETEVKLEVPGKGYLKVQRTIPNDIIEFSLTPGIALPYTKTDREQPLDEQVFAGAGIHITSKDPIIVYGVLRFAYTSDGYLAIPISAFGKEYIVASWPDPSGGHNASQWLPSYTSIITAYDKTSVRVTLGGEDWTETAAGRWPGDVISERMNEADVLNIGTISKHGDLTGTKVRGNLPLGVISGNFCAYIPTGIAACDVLIEMDLPTNTWGTEYHVTPIYSRFKNSLIRVFAKETDTQIYRDGQALGLIPKAGGLHGEGWLEYRAAEGAPIPVVISGNKPISVTQYNPGIQDDAANDTDPFQMILTPLEQYQEEIVFNTPGIRGGFGFDNNFINVVYEATEYGTIPDDLLFAEVKDGKFEWIQFNTMESDPGDEFQVKINNKRYFSKTIRLNHDGVYKIKSSAPFTAYAYGNSWCDTYGFPTSVALGDLSIPDTVAPDPEWDIDCFGDVEGKVTDMPDEAEYRSNLSLIYMASQHSYNYRFEYGTIIAGETRKTNWSLEVIDNQQEARAVLVFSDRRGNDTTIVIDFYPTLISIHEDEYNFGRLAVGETADHTFWVVNESKVGELDLTQLKLLFGTQGFEITENPINVIVPPLDSVSFKVKFTATKEGMYEDSIGVGDPCFFWYKAYVQANVGAPRILVGRYDFGSVLVDANKFGIVTVQNIGSSALEIYSYTGPELEPVYKVLDWMAFEEYGEDPTAEKPWIIKPGVEQIFEVKFTPDAEALFLDSVVFTSNTDRPIDTHIDSVGELTGTGIKANLIANGYDWLRRRIDRPGTFDVLPYPVEAPDKVIFLENSGTTPVMIKNIKISEDTEGDAFEFDRSELINRQIPEGSDLHVPVDFHPVVTGVHTLRFTYNNTADSPTETLLQGVGIVPRLTTEDMIFGVTEVDDFANAILKTIKITNLSRTTWEFCDSVTITDLTVSPAGAIATSINGDVYGSEGFRFDINALRVMDATGTVVAAATSLPIVLQPGQYIEVDAEFVAPRPTDLTASITTVSDAEAEQTSVWTGAGFNLDLTTGTTSVVTCVYDPKTITLTLTHNGAAGTAGVQPIHVETITFDDANQKEFDFANAADKGNFDINPGASYDVIFDYDPLTEGVHTTDLTIVSNILAPNDIDHVTLTSEAVHYDRAVSVRIPADMNKLDDTHQLFEIGALGNIYLQLDAGEDMAMAAITSMGFTLRYNPEFIKILPSGITSAISGYTVSNTMVDHETGQATFYLNGPSFNHPGGTDLIKVEFGTYLPKTDKDNMDFTVLVDAGGSACVEMTATGSNVEVKKTCVYDLRKVQLSGTEYVLQAISPNPVRNHTDINFAIGMETYTTVEIFNSTGELVATPINKVMQTGKYSVIVPVHELPSGTYWVVLKSGQFTQQQRMIIVK